MVLAFAFDVAITEWVQRMVPPDTWLRRLLKKIKFTAEKEILQIGSEQIPSL